MKKSLTDNEYNIIADSYAELIPTKAHNAYYERPATLSLLPYVENMKILDAGCGTGVYTKILLEKGAIVTGMDANEKMLNHAKELINDKAEFILGNLEEPLIALSDNAFDGILSALTITYIKDLKSTFNEFSRILKKNGWFLFSTEHPFFQYRLHNLEDYYDIKQLEYEWIGFGETVVMKSYYHNLHTITDALNDNGFYIEKILEPQPVGKFRETTNSYEEFMKFPLFICFLARKIV